MKGLAKGIHSTNSFGNASTDLYVAKLTADGNKVWFRTYGGKGVDVATDILPRSPEYVE